MIDNRLSIDPTIISRSLHEADDTSRRLGVASQSDVADDRVSTEKASPLDGIVAAGSDYAHRGSGVSESYTHQILRRE